MTIRVGTLILIIINIFYAKKIGELIRDVECLEWVRYSHEKRIDQLETKVIWLQCEVDKLNEGSEE